MESRDSCRAGNDRAWKVDGRAQALVGQGRLATTLAVFINICVWTVNQLYKFTIISHSVKSEWLSSVEPR